MMVMKNLFFFFAFLFCGPTFGQFIKGANKKELSTEPDDSTYDAGFQKIIDQLKSEDVAANAGHRLVIVYEKPSECPVENDSTRTETEYTTITTTIDTFVTRAPSNCQEKVCEPKVEIVLVTSTYTIAANAHVTVTAEPGNRSPGSSKSGKGGSGEDNRPESDSESGDSGDWTINSSKDSNNNAFDSYGAGNWGYGNSPRIAGAFALQIIADLGVASTSTIFKNAATTSVEYVSRPTALSMTRQNPILELETLKGPNSIKINDWAFAATISANEEYSYSQGVVKGGASAATMPMSNEVLTKPSTPITAMAQATASSTKQESASITGVSSHNSNGTIDSDSDSVDLQNVANSLTVLLSSSENLSSEVANSKSSGSSASDPSSIAESRILTSSNPSVSDAELLVGSASSNLILESPSDSESSIMEISKPSDLSSESSSVSEVVVLTPKLTCINNDNLFKKISDMDPQQFYAGKQHPVEIPHGVTNELPYETNKFYANLFLGTQDRMVYVWPYEVYWEHTEKNGLAVQYPDPTRKNFGGEGVGGGNQYYWNAIMSAGVFIGATSITKDQNFMSVSDMREFSVKVKLSPENDATKNYIEFPLVEGMGLVSSIYHGNLIAKIQGNGGISNFTKVEYQKESNNTMMYRLDVGFGETWLLMITLPTADSEFEMKKEADTNYLVGSKAVDGLVIQVALAPPQDENNLEAVYYGLAGQYVTDAKVSGGINCEQVNYKIGYETKGTSLAKTPLVFALPHHSDLFDGEMKNRDSSISLPSTTKGMMQGYLSAELLFSHKIDNKVQWLPYLRDRDNVLTYKKKQIELIRNVTAADLKDVDIVKTIFQIRSQYFMGKAVDKYAYMMYVLHEIVKDEEMADEILKALKEFFKEYKNHKSILPLFYDTKFKGVTSEGAFISETEDFGNGFYNDHNFHYSYIIHAAAIVGKIDAQKGGDWAMENKEFINTLVRDVANPSEEDTYFPVSRSFDWFQGHSWAHGITEFADGKDLESTSEDVHFSYAMKLWGHVTGDEAMEARGDLMLSIQTKAFDQYFLYKDDNTVVPKQILKNKVSGIFFENKVDYATWFGANTEYKHGIQMIPITPALGSVRSSEFAKQEWDQVLSNVNIKGAWMGVLSSGRVFFEPAASWNYFANPNFDHVDMDDGQSRAWALAFSAPFMNELENFV